MALTKAHNRMINSSPVNVKDLGAIGDGVTNDRAAVILALASNRNVIFPEGTYLIKPAILIESVSNLNVNAEAANFIGESRIFRFKNCSNVNWEGGKFTGDNTNTTGDAEFDIPGYFTYNNSTNCKVSKTIISGVGSGFTAASNKFVPITTFGVNTESILISKNIVSDGDDNTIWSFYGNNITISENIVKDQLNGRAICLQALNSCTVSDNTILSCAGDGISLMGTSNTSVVGNTLRALTIDTILTTSRAIAIEVNEAASVAAFNAQDADENLIPTTSTDRAYCRNVIVAGNTCKNGRQAFIVGAIRQADSTFVSNNGKVLFSNNLFTFMTTGGDIKKAKYFTLSNNDFTEFSNEAFRIDLAASQCSITDNEIDYFNTAGTGATAIIIDDADGLSPSGSAPWDFNTGTSIVIAGNKWSNGNTKRLTGSKFSKNGYMNIERGNSYISEDPLRNHVLFDKQIALADGIAAPTTLAGYAQIYVDTADGDLKIKFGDGTVKTIVTDT